MITFSLTLKICHSVLSSISQSLISLFALSQNGHCLRTWEEKTVIQNSGVRYLHLGLKKVGELKGQKLPEYWQFVSGYSTSFVALKTNSFKYLCKRRSQLYVWKWAKLISHAHRALWGLFPPQRLGWMRTAGVYWMSSVQLLFSRLFLVWSLQHGALLRSSASRRSNSAPETIVRGSPSSLRVEASPLQTPAPPKVDGLSDRFEG